MKELSLVRGGRFPCQEESAPFHKGAWAIGSVPIDEKGTRRPGHVPKERKPVFGGEITLPPKSHPERKSTHHQQPTENPSKTEETP